MNEKYNDECIKNCLKDWHKKNIEKLNDAFKQNKARI